MTIMLRCLQAPELVADLFAASWHAGLDGVAVGALVRSGYADRVPTH